MNDDYHAVIAAYVADLDQTTVGFRTNDHRESVVQLPDSDFMTKRVQHVAITDAVPPS
jgi:hypothetical protein